MRFCGKGIDGNCEKKWILCGKLYRILSPKWERGYIGKLQIFTILDQPDAK